jgi:pimeloyl-ACP methyl ester carboxylesterase
MSLLDRMLASPTLGCALPHRGFVRYRQAREHAGGVPLVLLHGIGSGSGSWTLQLQCEALGHVLAWDAPGYADSTALKVEHPVADDYAQVLWAWLDELSIHRVHLVGHSLGCIMAAGAAKLQAHRVQSLTLLSPAQGYGAASVQEREKKTQDRLQALADLGLAQMAAQRAPRLLSENASKEQIALATHLMSHLNEGGYSQATHLLGAADIRAELQAFRGRSQAPIRVACGAQDLITPLAACQALAWAFQANCQVLPETGHLCAIEAAYAVSDYLITTIQQG